MIMKIKEKTVVLNKNLSIFKLLLRVPEFKKDIEATRIKFDIKESGFKWGGRELYDWAVKNNIEYYQIDGSEDPADWPLISDASVRKDFPSNNFEERLYELGTKYRLPFNFYGFPYRAMARYILSNDITDPAENYDIGFRDFRDDRLMWTSLIAYAPLSKKEAKQAMERLEDTQFRLLPIFIEGIDVIGKKRFGKNTERDLTLFDEQSMRSEKPKRIKKVKEGSYLEIVNKSKLSDAQKRKAIKNNKHDITVGYSSPTSKEIGKKQKVSAAVARQSKSRSNSVAKELFGYSLGL